MNDIYSMGLHETSIGEDGNLFTTIIRVPGGWVYRSYDKSFGILGMCFVPYDAEFHPASDTVKVTHTATKTPT